MSLRRYPQSFGGTTGSWCSARQLLTRTGKDATKWYPEIAHELAKLPPGFVLDGEACLLDEKVVPHFEGMRGRLRSNKREPMTYFVFDLLFHDGQDLRPLPVIERKAKLKELIGVDTYSLRYVAHVETHGEAMFEGAQKLGMEGVVAKKADSTYKGGRSRLWCKFKAAGWHDGFHRRRQR